MHFALDTIQTKTEKEVAFIGCLFILLTLNGSHKSQLLLSQGSQVNIWHLEWLQVNSPLLKWITACCNLTWAYEFKTQTSWQQIFYSTATEPKQYEYVAAYVIVLNLSALSHCNWLPHNIVIWLLHISVLHVPFLFQEDVISMLDQCFSERCSITVSSQ